MQLASSYRLAPGCCFSCRGAGSKKIVDFNRDELVGAQGYRSAVYLCDLCITAAYQMLDPDTVLIGKQKLADLLGENTALTNEVTRLIDEATALDVRLASALRSTSDA